MKFGIMAMQLDRLIPTGLAPDQIMAYITSFNQAELVRQLANTNFKWIELGGDLAMFIPHSFHSESIQQLKTLQKELDLGYTVHLPLWSVEPSTPLQQVRRGSIEAIVQSIQSTLSLTPEVYVLHATGALAAEFYRMRISESARALLLRQFQANAADSIHRILNETSIPSRRLAVETIEFPLDMTLELAEKFDLSVCLDTGHILSGFSGSIDFSDALDLCLPRLAEIHLHDSPRLGSNPNIVYGVDHQALGKGDLDIKLLFERVKTYGFDGPVIFELSFEEALESMRYIHHILPDI